MFAASAVAAALAFASSANAFYRLTCAKPVLDARVDPIVSPGAMSGHAHTIMGSSNIGINSDFNSLRESTCTTCIVKDDLSAYWIPQLYYEFPNKTYSAVDHGGMEVYYLQRGASNETIQAFPDGLRMVTGNPALRSYAGTPASQAISWLCLNYNNPATAQQPNLYSTDCPDGLRAQVFFPGCWDGVNLDSADHASHMAYPSGIDNGGCPPSHPVHLISIFYEVWYSVDPFNKLNAGGKFLLSTGDYTGYSLHGDFMTGWNRTTLQRSIDTCTADSGVIQDCPVFADEGRFNTDDEQNACMGVQPTTERIDTPLLPFLPGCVLPQDGPANANTTLKAPGCTVIGLDGNSTTPVGTSASVSVSSTTSTHSSSSTPVVVVSTSTFTSASTSVHTSASTSVHTSASTNVHTSASTSVHTSVAVSTGKVLSVSVSSSSSSHAVPTTSSTSAAHHATTSSASVCKAATITHTVTHMHTKTVTVTATHTAHDGRGNGHWSRHQRRQSVGGIY